MKKTFNVYLQIFSVFFLILITAKSYALPFSITPAAALPTQIAPSQTLTATYLVKNLAAVTLSNAFVKYLPPNVKQVTTDNTVPALCGSSFTLSANASCVLELAISGTVNGADPNPQHHLFVCMQNGLLCAGTPSPLNVTSTASTPIPGFTFVAGYYYQTFANVYPFVLATQDEGDTWAAQVSSQTPNLMPENTALALVIATGCQGAFCLAAGEFINSSFPQGGPYVIQTNNTGGLTWQVSVNAQTPALPSNFSTGIFRLAGCSDSFCVTGSGYTATSSVTYPFLAATTNKGVSWSYVVTSQTPTLPSDYSNGGQVQSISCTASWCAATGQYLSSNSNNYPFIVKSFDGSNWSYIFNSQSSGLPGDFNSLSHAPGSGPTMACTNNLCVLVGAYLAVNSIISGPLAMYSTDGALTWHTGIDDTQYPGDYGFGGGLLNTGACSSEICIAAGYYQSTTDGNLYGLIFQSQNGGPWTIGLSSTVGSAQNGLIFTASTCSGSTCIAAGRVNNVDLGIIYTHDSGNTWVAAPTPVAPSNYVSTSVISQVACKGETCLVSGTYSNSGGGSNGFVVKTVDGGASWNYVVPGPGVTLPSDAVGANGALGNFDTSPPSMLMKKIHQHLH